MNVECLFIYFSVVSFQKDFVVFFWYKFFTSLVKLIPKVCILFDAVVHEIVFLNSFSDSSLLVYINATDFFLYLFSILLLSNKFG